MKVFGSLAVGIFALFLPGTPVLAQVKAGQGTSSMDAGSDQMLKSADNAFALKAAQGGQAEVQLGQLAVQKAANPRVKAFGQQMVDDHSKANDQLKQIASQDNMTLPQSLDPKDQALMNKLQNETGDKFDHDYVRAMVKDHEQDVKQFRKEANNGKNDRVKEFASQTLPTLEQHLARAKQLETTVKK